MFGQTMESNKKDESLSIPIQWKLNIMQHTMMVPGMRVEPELGNLSLDGAWEYVK